MNPSTDVTAHTEQALAGVAPTRNEKMVAGAARFAQRNGALAVLLVMIVAMSFTYPTFATVGNFTTLAQQISMYALIALGMTFVIFTGGIDLSVGSVFCLGGVLAAWASQYGLLWALVVPLVVCGLIGVVHGVIVAHTDIPAFIVTLAGMLFARGLLLVLSNEGSTTYKVPTDSAFLKLAQGSVLGLRNSVWIVALAFIIGYFVQHRTTYGSTLLAIGGQPEAAELMGLPVVRSKVIVYTVSALLAAFSGVLTASLTASGVTTLGVGLEMTAISAVVLGGTALMGGAGSVVGSLVGMVLLQVVANLINRLGLTDSNWQSVVNGVLLVAVATAQAFLMRAQARRDRSMS